MLNKIKSELQCSDERAKSILNQLILLRIKSDYTQTKEEIWENEKQNLLNYDLTSIDIEKMKKQKKNHTKFFNWDNIVIAFIIGWVVVIIILFANI